MLQRPFTTYVNVRAGERRKSERGMEESATASERVVCARFFSGVCVTRACMCDACAIAQARVLIISYFYVGDFYVGYVLRVLYWFIAKLTRPDRHLPNGM